MNFKVILTIQNFFQTILQDFKLLSNFLISKQIPKNPSIIKKGPLTLPLITTHYHKTNPKIFFSQISHQKICWKFQENI